MPVHIINETPLAVGFMAGRVHHRPFDLTAIVKGAFKLQPGAAAVFDERPFLSGDIHWDDDPEKSCRYASDFAPFKPRADVLVSGTCHAPGGAPQPTVHVALRLGKLHKTLTVWGDRHFVQRALGRHSITDPAPFRSIPLRWEKAFGGDGFPANPLGVGYVPPGDLSLVLPNVEVADALIRQPTDLPVPGGLGPIDKRWRARTSKLGSYAGAWTADRWPDFPDDFDWGYFNAAPGDQQVDFLRGDEPMTVDGMHPELARFEARLPGVRPRCFLRRSPDDSVPPEEVALALDTVFIDMDQATVVLVWRGLAKVASRDYAEIDRALIVTERVADEPMSADHYHAESFWRPSRPTPEELALQEEAVARADEVASPALPPPGVRDEPDPEEVAVLDASRADLERAGVDPSILGRLKGVTRASVFNAILVEELEKLAAKGEETADAPSDEPEDEDDGGEGLDKTLADLEKAGVDPAVLARLATATTAPRFLEILLDAMPGELTVDEKQRRRELVENLRKMEADTNLSITAAEGGRRAARGDRLTRDEALAVVARGGSLAEANLTELDLSGVTLRGVNLSGAKLDGAKLSRSDLCGADLTSASMRLCDLTAAVATETVFHGADLEGATLSGAELSRAQLGGANLSDAHLDGATLDDADLVGARLARSSLDGASMKNALLDQADLTSASLRRVRAPKVKLRKARLEGASFEEAQLDGAILIGCVMDQARFDAASLCEAHLDDATGADASFVGALLTNARANGAALPRGRFQKVSGEGSSWPEADLAGAELGGASLRGAIFRGAILSGASFELARLEEADLSGAKLDRAMLRRANLFRARLGGADLTDADVRSSNLFECDLFEAVVTRARFEQANLKRTCLDRRSPA